MRKMQISREEWLRGEGSTHSRLLRPEDNKRCCIGIYLRECGMSDEALMDKASAHDIGLTGKIPEEAGWLYQSRVWTGDFDGTYEALRLYRINDDRHLSERDREDEIKELFLRYGNVEVEFI